MELVYHKSESAIKQPEIYVGVTTVYLRRNYSQVEKEDMNGEKYLMWVYEEAQLTKDEALFLLAEQNSELTLALHDADSMNIDHEFRITMLELGLTDEF